MREVRHPSLLPLWEKVSPQATDEGYWTERQRLIMASTPHPPCGHLLTVIGEKG